MSSTASLSLTVTPLNRSLSITAPSHDSSVALVLAVQPEFASEPHRSWVLPLHSLLPPDEQTRVFSNPPRGVRKVVLATNIAETAITVDDCS